MAPSISLSPRGPTSDPSLTAQPSKLYDMNILSHIYAVEATMKRRTEALEADINDLKLSRAEDKARAANLQPLSATDASKSISVAALGADTSANTGPDAAVSSLKGPVTVTSTKDHMPLTVRRLPALSTLSLPQAMQPLDQDTVLQTFTASFLTSIFGGEEWSPGLYYPAKGPSSATDNSKATKALLPKSRTYYVIDAELEPFIPTQPGEHGAKLSVFFNEFEEEKGQYRNVPLFVCLPGNKGMGDQEKQYSYMGNYTQPRWSDKLDYDHSSTIVPMSVKRHWAQLLARKDGRPEWMEEALMKAFWPQPTYVGAMPGRDDTTEDTVTGASSVTGKSETAASLVKEDVQDYIEELREWKRDATMKVGLLKAENIMEAFEKEDAAEEPGLRFWWEYLQCVGFDRNFYYMLATCKKDVEEGKGDC